LFLDNYTLARAKAKKAEYTSELSTNDSSSRVESNISSKGKKILKKQKQTEVNRVMWSPKSIDNSCKLYFLLIKCIFFYSFIYFLF